MAKRKRLTVPEDPGTVRPAPETVPGMAPAAPMRAPIAQVTGEAAAQSALQVLADEIQSARHEGRLVQALPLEEIEAEHLVRDRMVIDEEEMAALKSSIHARGQQTPVEVVSIATGRYGLISGWRRLQALRSLHAETGESRFATIAALVRPPRSVSDSYLAMVEENEIRAGLSHYERAHLACAAVALGVFDSTQRAVRTLFPHGSAARRSKIVAFVRLHEALGAALRFPAAIPERLGLALAAALDRDAGFGPRLCDALRKSPPEGPVEERAALERALKRAGRNRAAPDTAPAASEVVQGIALTARQGRAVLSGAGVTDEFVEDLRRWLAER